MHCYTKDRINFSLSFVNMTKWGSQSLNMALYNKPEFKSPTKVNKLEHLTHFTYIYLQECLHKLLLKVIIYLHMPTVEIQSKEKSFDLNPTLSCWYHIFVPESSLGKIKY